MTRRHDLEHQISVLAEIKGILGAMKNLAMLELRKLSRMRTSQNRAFETIQTALWDFTTSYGLPLVPPSGPVPLVLLVGSERGFCGNFNGMLIENVQARLHDVVGADAHLITVGNKLASLLEGRAEVVESLPAPNVAEEVVRVLVNVMNAVAAFRGPGRPYEGAPLWIAYHETESGDVRIEELTAIAPPPQELGFRTRVRIQLPPAQLLLELIEQHLFAAVTRAVYASLIAENRFRLAHMDGATRRIDSRLEEITLRRNIQRQEEITQEMELILLSAGMLEDKRA